MFERVATGTPAVMGIVNVTPDSFSDGGRFLRVDAARDHGLALVADGATLLDVGGESTRPGADPVAASEERARVVPVVEALVAATSVPVSVDTTKASVAAAAIDAGASIVNDVSAGRHDPEMLGTVAAHRVGYIAMHMQGEPRSMQDDPRYDDVVGEVIAFLADRLDAARAAGVPDGFLAADPGIGFGKTTDHNLALLAATPRIVDELGVPIVVGTSRKRFLADVLAARGVAATDAGPLGREHATLATVAWALTRGAAAVRVHVPGPSARVATLVRELAA